MSTRWPQANIRPQGRSPHQHTPLPDCEEQLHTAVSKPATKARDKILSPHWSHWDHFSCPCTNRHVFFALWQFPLVQTFSFREPNCRSVQSLQRSNSWDWALQEWTHLRNLVLPSQSLVSFLDFSCDNALGYVIICCTGATWCDGANGLLTHSWPTSDTLMSIQHHGLLPKTQPSQAELCRSLTSYICPPDLFSPWRLLPWETSRHLH